MYQAQICNICLCSEKSCYDCKEEEKCSECNSADACCSETHISWHTEQINKGVTLEYISIGWLAIEIIGSIIGGLFLGSSIALLAFGGDSIIELVSSYTTIGHLKEINKGKPHSKINSKKVEKVNTVLLLLLIPTIAIGAVYLYISGIRPEASLLGIAVALGAVIIMPILWTQKKRIGIATNCPPLKIDAIESQTCFFMSIALLGGLLINYSLHIGWVDYIATGIILVFVAKEALEAYKG